MSPDTSQPQDETLDALIRAVQGCGVPIGPDAAQKIARAALAVARPLIAADVQQRIAVALDQRKGDPRYGAALFVQRLDLNLTEDPR